MPLTSRNDALAGFLQHFQWLWIANRGTLPAKTIVGLLQEI